MLTDVYKRHSKDTADKVPGLVSKADNPKKFGTLLYKLTSKFPKMIKKVKDPQQEYWENMMKKAQEEPPPDKPKQVPGLKFKLGCVAAFFAFVLIYSLAVDACLAAPCSA